SWFGRAGRQPRRSLPRAVLSRWSGVRRKVGPSTKGWRVGDRGPTRGRGEGGCRGKVTSTPSLILTRQNSPSAAAENRNSFQISRGGREDGSPDDFRKAQKGKSAVRPGRLFAAGAEWVSAVHGACRAAVQARPSGRVPRAGGDKPAAFTGVPGARA